MDISDCKLFAGSIHWNVLLMLMRLISDMLHLAIFSERIAMYCILGLWQQSEGQGKGKSSNKAKFLWICIPGCYWLWETLAVHNSSWNLWLMDLRASWWVKLTDSSSEETKAHYGIADVLWLQASAYIKMNLEFMPNAGIPQFLDSPPWSPGY